MPAKFDDISKTASSVLGDDFQCKDFQLKAKQKTNFNGVSSELVVDMWKAGDVKTPAKLTFKSPKPFAMLDGLAVDKLDIGPDGKFKLECSLSKALHKVDGLKLEVKTDLKAAHNFAATYSGIKDAVVKVETKPAAAAPADITAEVLYGIGPAVIGAKLETLSNLVPSVGVNFAQGDMFASVIAKNQFSEFTCHGHYTVSSDIKVAATFQQGGKTSGAWAAGGAYSISKEMSAKAKFDSNNALSVAFKRDLAQGTTLFGGVSYNVNSGAMGYGAKLNIE